ncbi:MAG: alpha/beta hydrolase family protein [Hylemonella sp.]
MTKDPRIQSAISHWAPRFVSNGVLLTDFQEVTESLTRWEQWTGAWCQRAKVHEDLGREALSQDFKLSASEHLSRAAVYYHFAKFVSVHDIDEMRAAHMKAVECKQLALPHMRPPARRVEIPYENGFLAGFLRLPYGAVKPPVLIMVPGLDSAKEELEAYELPFLARGMATLMVDGPGQGEAEYQFPIRGDYEVAVKAMVDWLLNCREVDSQRIGLWGVSLGGYYAPRAAAFEKRLKACIGLAGPYCFGDTWDALPELTREAFRVRSHLKTQEEAKAYSHTLTLKNGISQQIECPLFLVTGKLDRIIPWQDTQRMAQEASGPVELLIVEDGNHIANNRPYRYRLRTADWMAQQLGLLRI